MPHKHKLPSTARSKADFDLDPSQRAQPLHGKGKKPIDNKKSNGPSAPKPKSKKRPRPDADDTPAAFKRLMAKQAHLSTSRRPVSDSSAPPPPSNPKSTTSTAPVPAPPKAKGNTDPSPLLPRDPSNAPPRARTTRLQRKIERKVSAWRAADAKRNAREADMRSSLRDEREAQIADLLEKSGVGVGVMHDEEFLKEVGLGYEDERDTKEEDEGKKKKEGRKRKGKKEGEDDWAVLMEKRGARPKLGDVVQAPPELRKVREVFKDKKKDDTEGGLKRKAELGEARLEVIRRYREMMGRKGGL